MQNNNKNILTFNSLFKKWGLGFSIFLSIFLSIKINTVYAATSQNEPITDSGFQITLLKCHDATTNAEVDPNSGECSWNDLLELGSRIIKFLLYISLSLATLSMTYAGFLYVTAFGKMGQVEKAHGIFTTVITGLLIAFGAWLIVATILKTLGANEAFSLLNFSSVTPYSTK